MHAYTNDSYKSLVTRLTIIACLDPHQFRSKTKSNLHLMVKANTIIEQVFACEHETKQELMFCILNLSSTKFRYEQNLDTFPYVILVLLPN